MSSAPDGHRKAAQVLLRWEHLFRQCPWLNQIHPTARETFKARYDSLRERRTRKQE